MFVEVGVHKLFWTERSNMTYGDYKSKVVEGLVAETTEEWRDVFQSMEFMDEFLADTSIEEVVADQLGAIDF